MGLSVEPVSTQVIPRDRHAMYFATLGVVASSVERLAIEIRHLQRTEVLEAEEYFAEGQKGSSAMPHKRNPVLTENLTGLARMVRAYALPAMENVALWHERDISHSSVERMIGPDATVTLDFALARLTGVIDGLVVYPESMRRNLDRLGGLVHSQRVLLALTQKGVSREDAYRLVQRNAMPVWRGEGDFLTLLKRDRGGRGAAVGGGAGGAVRPRLPPQARRHDLRAGVRRGASASLNWLGEAGLTCPLAGMIERRRFRGENSTFQSLLDRVERGEDVIITRHGQSGARLVPAARGAGAEAKAAVERIRAASRGACEDAARTRRPSRTSSAGRTKADGRRMPAFVLDGSVALAAALPDERDLRSPASARTRRRPKKPQLP